MSADLVLSRLERVRRYRDGWIGRCPAHDDTTASLSIGIGHGDRILLHDFGGCDTEKILAALNLSFRDLFPPKRGVR